MLSLRFLCTVALPLLAGRALAQNFTVSNGQIFTPGFAILDSPQPGTPMGGDTLEVALDVTADGVLPLGVAGDSPSRINNITVFLYSYDTNRNFTISNGTATANNASLGEVMAQEPSSTVKHVKWTWPDCLVGNGQPSGTDSDRGTYNISIRQNFVLNGTNYYTIFDVPISVTNSIDNSTTRPSCDSINNPLLTPEQINTTAANAVGVLFAPGTAHEVQVKMNKTESGQGLGGAGTWDWRTGAHWVCLANLVVAFTA